VEIVRLKFIRISGMECSRKILAVDFKKDAQWRNYYLASA